MWGRVLKIVLQAAGYAVLNWQQIKPFWNGTIGKIFHKKQNENKPVPDTEIDNKQEGAAEGKTKNN